MRYSLKIYILMLLAVLATGCRSTRQTIVTPVEEPAPARELTVTTFTAMVNGVSATGQLRVARDSVMWVSVNKLVELARGMATRDSVWLTLPLGDKRFAGTYDDLARLTKRRYSYDELQAMALADDAGEQISRLAASLGFNAEVYITGRKRVSKLTFPFRKQ